MEEQTIQIKDLELIYSGKEIVIVPELNVYMNEKIGIIGENGSGKTSLMKLIAHQLTPTKGTIQTSIDFQYYAQMDDVVEESITDLDGALLSRFTVPTTDVQNLSGGEMTKYRLTQLLSTYQSGMLLDEPTTHLDQRGKQQLIEELRYYYGTLLFISHDRFFLNELAEKIWEIKDGKITEYKGNYDAYLQQKEHEKNSQERAHQEYQKEMQRLTKGIQEKKQKAEQAGKISDKKKKQNVRPDRLSSSKQKDTVQKNLYKQAKAMTSRLEQLKEVQGLERETSIKFPKHETAEIHNPYPLRIEKLTVTYDQKRILDEVDFQLPLGKKVAVVGSNGAGKSTLLQAILDGHSSIVLSPKVKIETYRQMDYQLSSQRSLLLELMTETDWPESTVRSLLHHLGFSQDEVFKPLSVLSGGEATRVAIAQLFTRPSNLLILDEPTNFIDLTTIQALEMFLKEYTGTVLFTSHDPHFIELADEVWELKNGKLV